jgi:hypothetical protein
MHTGRSAAFGGLLTALVIAGCSRPGEAGNAEKEYQKKFSLKGTEWVSEFYHYRNKYYFETDSTGYAQHGQFAWSCPVDTIALGITGDSILYSNNEPFRYWLNDTVLQLQFLSALGPDRRKFYLYMQEEQQRFRSDHEYSYGREYLDQEKNR